MFVHSPAPAPFEAGRAISEDSSDDDDEAGSVALRRPPAADDAAAGRSAAPASAPAPASAAAASGPAVSSSLDLNLASASALSRVLQPAMCARVLEERTAHGPFLSLRDLDRRVKGLGEKKCRKLADAGFVIGTANDAVSSAAAAPAQPAPTPAVVVHQAQQPQQAFVASELSWSPAEPVAPTLVAAVAASSSDATVSPVAASSPLPASAPLLLPAMVSSSYSLRSPSPPPPAAVTMQYASERQEAQVEAWRRDDEAPQASCWSSILCCSSQQSPSHGQANLPEEPLHFEQPTESAYMRAVATAASAVVIEPEPAVVIEPDVAAVELQLSQLTVTAAPAITAAPVVTATAPVVPSAASSASAPPSLRCGSWNLCHFNTKKASDPLLMNVIAEVIVQQRYDFIVLLEVRTKEACDILLSRYLNNPNRPRPKHAHAGDVVDDGVGHWRFEFSEVAEYGSDAAPEVEGEGKGASRDFVLEADIVEEIVAADGSVASAAVHARTSVSERIAEGEDEGVVAALGSMTLQESVFRSDAAGFTSSAASWSAASSVAVKQPPTTPQRPGPSVASPFKSPHHRQSSSGSKRPHKKREHYAWFYRSDRVELPNGCRLYQTKAGADDRASAASNAAAPYVFWRSPCYALVRSVHASSSSSAAPVLSWLMVALHVIWGTGLTDVLHECQHLQQLYNDIATSLPRFCAPAISPEADHNCAVALIGDFNVTPLEPSWNARCLPLDLYAPLMPMHQCSTFSAANTNCNLYDQIYVARDVLAAVAREKAVQGEVVYFDRAFFPAPSADSLSVFDLAAAERTCRENAKRVADHRPIVAHLPVHGDVRRIPVPQIRGAPYDARPKSPPKRRAPRNLSSDFERKAAASPALLDSLPSALLSDTSSVRSLLTIVITTSAIPAHPSTDLMDCLMYSFTLMPELADVRRVIMCDWPKEIVADDEKNDGGDDAERNVYKRGVITQRRLDNYLTCVSELRTKYERPGECDIVQLKSYHGFAHAVKAALADHVRTPYVLICQHDYIVTLPVPIARLVRAMHESHSPRAAAVPQSSVATLPSPLNYIGFVNKSVKNHLSQCARGMPAALATHPLHRLFDVSASAPSLPSDTASTSLDDSPDVLRLCPLLFHFDKTHLASVAYYRHVLAHPRMQAVGTFVEDEYGVDRLEAIRALDDASGLQSVWANELGSYLYWADPKGVKICLRHIHGRRFDVQRIGGFQRFSGARLADAVDEEEIVDAAEQLAMYEAYLAK